MKFMIRSLVLMICAATLFAQVDSELQIVIETDSIETDPVVSPYTPKPKVTLENSVFKAVFRLNEGGYEGIEHAFIDIVIKSKSRDIVNKYVDACAQRPAADNAYITYDGTDRKTVRLEFNSGSRTGVVDYSIYPNSPAIKVDYLVYEYGWANIVDQVNVGLEQQVLFGMDDFIRPLQFYPDSYWNTYDEPYKSTDPVDGGSLNYNGYSIMAIGDSTEGSYGLGRVLPFFTMDVNGGVRLIKLLSWGFENFISTGNNSNNRKAFTGYIYVWDDGRENAIELGTSIVDNHLAYGNPLPVELVSFDYIADADSVVLNWATATEVNNYGFNILRQNLTLGEIDWANIGFVLGHGNSNTPHYYSFADTGLSPGNYLYRLQQIDTNGGSSYSDTLEVEVTEVVGVNKELNISEQFSLSQNFPNPFNPSTKIGFSIPQAGDVKIKIYDVLGCLITNLIENKRFSAGRHNVEFNASNLNSGIYFYQIEYLPSDGSGYFKDIRKMVLLK